MRNRCVDSAFQLKLQEASLAYARKTISAPQYHELEYMRIGKEYCIRSRINVIVGIAAVLVCDRLLSGKYRR